jgi:predicted DCC family thiol-disulfide oxidoreductase YuxK
MATQTAPHRNSARPEIVAAGPLTVLYDDECGVCRETVRRLRRWDRVSRFEFMPLAEAASSGRPLLESLAAEGHLADAIHVVDESSGRVVRGGHAALTIIESLPGGWLLRPWASLPSTTLAAEIVYQLAARHRERVAWVVGLRDDVSCPLRPAEPPALDLATPQAGRSQGANRH